MQVVLVGVEESLYLGTKWDKQDDDTRGLVRCRQPRGGPHRAMAASIREGDGGNKLKLPLGGGIAKTTRIGKMPLRLAGEVQYFVASTDRFGPDWLFKLTISPVIPSKYTRN